MAHMIDERAGGGRMNRRSPTTMRLLQAGVRNLKEFGYPSVSVENITTDFVFRRFFQRMLEEAKEASTNPTVQADIDALLKEIAENEAKGAT